MQVTEINKPYPDPRHYAQEGGVIRFYESGFEFIASISNLSEMEIKAWREQPIRVGLYIGQEAIPYWIVETSEFSIDAGTNFRKVAPELRDKWLTADFNLVQFTLIERRTGIVKGIRALGLKPGLIQNYKDCLKRQLWKYPTKEATDKQQQILQHLLPTAAMSARADFQNFGWSKKN